MKWKTADAMKCLAWANIATIRILRYFIHDCGSLIEGWSYCRCSDCYGLGGKRCCCNSNGSGSMLIALHHSNLSSIATFEDILVKIFDCFDGRTNFHIDVCVVPLQKCWIIRHNPSVIKLDPISAILKRLSAVRCWSTTILRLAAIRHNSFHPTNFWIMLLTASCCLTARTIFHEAATWTVYHMFGN